MKPSLPILILISLSGAVASAVPMKLSDCSRTRKVREVPGHAGFFFNETCSTVYVLPPKIGSMKISGYLDQAGLTGACAQLKSLEEEHTSYAAILASYARRMKQAADEIEKIERQLQDGLIPVGQTRETLEDRINQLVEKYDGINAKVSAWEKQAYDRKLRYANTIGGQGRFQVDTGYAELVRRFRDANPGVRFEKMPLDQNMLSTVERSPTAEKSNVRMSPILELLVPGIGELPISVPGAMIADPAQLTKGNPGTIIIGEALSGEIALSEIGACTVGARLRSGQSIPLKAISDLVAANVTYQYQVQVRRHHRITYNMQELIQQLHKTVKRGGLFNPSTLNSFVDTRRTSSWITFHEESEDARFQYTDEYVKEIKREFLDRALKQVAAIKLDAPSVLVLAEAPGKNGADAVGQELQKCPHLYCQIGAGAAKALSAIFGSSKAVGSMVKQFDAEITETVSAKRMIPQYGTVTFE